MKWELTRRQTLAGFGMATSVALAGRGRADANGDTVHLFAIGGQSNANGKGDLSSGTMPPDVTEEVALEYLSGTDSLEVLNDPMEDEDDGSAWPAFAKMYYELTGIRSCYVLSAVGGSSQHKDAARTADDTWDVNNSNNYSDDLVSDVNNAISLLDSKGYDVVFQGILWNQGEKDAKSIFDGTITQSEYGSAFSDMIDFFSGEFGDNWQLYLTQTGRPGDEFKDHYHNIRQEQINQVRANDRVQLVSDEQQTFPERDMMRSFELHYNQTGLNRMGRVAAQSVVNGYQMNGPNRRLPAVGFADSPQTFGDNSTEKVSYDDTSTNTHGIFDIEANEIVVIADGIYEIYAAINFEVAEDSVEFRKRLIRNQLNNSGEVLDTEYQSSGDADQQQLVVSWRGELQAGEKIYTDLRQNNGDGNSYTTSGGDDNARLEIERVGLKYSEQTGDGPPPVIGSASPQDLDNDGLYEDVTGNGEFDIFDVQALFDNLESDAVQNNSEAFNFSGNNPSEVEIFDVQALFEML